ncbi:MAG: hypothetical protein JWO80_2416 [Bryobacterales bacterium]|nr:hypothetical protein [Bryobacterales bacterium]
MLKSIDILISLAVVMLAASMGVTMLTQIWSTLLNTRGVHLREGLAALLRQIDPRFSMEVARAVIEHLLKHPLIADGGRLGSLVHREEFTRLLLELASGEGPRSLPEVERQALAAALLANGVPDPGAALAKVRDLALSLELSHPALSASARHDMAILHAGSTDFVAKINGWFDQTIDRISARFTFTTRNIALANALLVAMAVPLDTLALINRLAVDDTLRGTLVQRAAANGGLQAASLQDIEKLAGGNLIPVPSSPAEWWNRWTIAKAPGTALSVLLLSMGAPFWFEALKNLLRLRSAIAFKDDGQRERRQIPGGLAPVISPAAPF